MGGQTVRASGAWLFQMRKQSRRDKMTLCGLNGLVRRRFNIGVLLYPYPPQSPFSPHLWCVHPLLLISSTVACSQNLHASSRTYLRRAGVAPRGAGPTAEKRAHDFRPKCRDQLEEDDVVCSKRYCAARTQPTSGPKHLQRVSVKLRAMVAAEMGLAD